LRDFNASSYAVSLKAALTGLMRLERTGCRMLRKLWLAMAAASILRAATPQEIERRIDELVARMTLTEKLGQMSQSSNMQAPLSDAIKEQIRQGRWGSFLNAGLTRNRAGAQRIARTESRLHIPLFLGAM
jgi:hypothetical protein